MKKILFTLLIAAMLLQCNRGMAEQDSDTYSFLHDYIDCLHTLSVATIAQEAKADNEMEQLKNNYSYLHYLGEAKLKIRHWIGGYDELIKNPAQWVADGKAVPEDATMINNVAFPLYSALLGIENKVRESIDIYTGEKEGTLNDIIKNTSEGEILWGTFFKDSGNLLFIITKPRSPENTELKGNLPYLITKKERLALIKYLNKMLGDDFKEYNEMYEKGLIQSGTFNPTMSTYSALHLKKLLSSDTYEEAQARDDSVNPYYFQ